MLKILINKKIEHDIGEHEIIMKYLEIRKKN
jgi:hypothetical protein